MSHYHVITLSQSDEINGEYEFEDFEAGLVFYLRTINVFLEEGNKIDIDKARPKVETLMMMQGTAIIDGVISLGMLQCLDECRMNKVVRN